MTILSLYIKSFGKLNDVRLDFKEGINVIANVNGFGKTTLANFVRAMLYGLTYGNAKGANVKHFEPWGCRDKFGGNLVVQHDGEIYRIERFFGTTARQEELQVFCANRPVTLPCEVGEYLLGLTADSYDRSAYFPQEAVALESNANFESKLANVVQNSAEDYDKVQQDIRNYRRDLKFERGMGGQLYQLDNERSNLQRELQRSLDAEARADHIKQRLTQIAEEKQSFKEQQEQVQEQAKKLHAEIATTELTFAEQANLAKLQALQAKLARTPPQIEEDKQRLDQLHDAISHTKDDVTTHPSYRANRIRKLLLVAFCFAMGIALGVILMLFVQPALGYVLGAVAICAGVVSGIVVLRCYHQPQILPSGERDALITKYFNIASQYVDDAHTLDYDGIVRQFWKYYSDYQADVREEQTLRAVIKQPNADATSLREQLNKLNERDEYLSSKYEGLVMEEGKLSQEAQTITFDSISIRERLQETDKKYNEAERKYNVAGVVARLLQQAKENLSSSYLPKLTTRCEQLFAEITNVNYQLIINRDFEVSIRTNGQTKAMGDFSRGTREILLLCFRVALAELLYNGAIPFMIVDDAFVNFDEDNFVRATALLKRLSAHAQIIYLTCHKRLGNLLK